MKKPMTTNNMEELQQVQSAIEALTNGVKGYLTFNLALIDDNELQETIDRVEARKILVINYIDKLVQENKELQLKLSVLNDYDVRTT